MIVPRNAREKIESGIYHVMVRGASFEGANLIDADLKHANLIYTIFYNSF